MPHGNDNFEAEKTANCKVFGRSVMSCAKTAEAIEMPFGIGARVGPRNHVLFGDPDRPIQRRNF